MANNTKAHNTELAQVAAEILITSGADITEAVSIVEMTAAMVSQTGCHPDTARRHLARAVRRARFTSLPDDVKFVINNWGGTRDGAGRGHTKPV